MSSYSEGQTHQLMESLEGAGYTPVHVTALGQNSNGVLDQLMLILTGVAKVVTDFVFRLVAKIDRNMDGWICVEPIDAEEGEFEPTICEFLREGENYVKGEELVKRAKEQGVLTSLRHAEAMLRNQERIPVEWRKYYLVFPEVWQSPAGGRSVFVLDWGGGRWCLFCRGLLGGFNSAFRLVGSRK